MSRVLAIFVIAVALTWGQTPIQNDPFGTPNLILNGNFSDGLASWDVEPRGTVRNGMLCVDVPANTPASASFIRATQSFTETKNDIYYLNFTANSSLPTNLWLQTQGEDPAAGGAPVDPNLSTTDCPLIDTPQNFSFPYSPANQGDNANFTIYLGGQAQQTSICIGSISLRRINRLPYTQDTGPAIKVNQLGYLPDGPKFATFATSLTNAATWQLKDESGKVVATGQTLPRGVDNSSRLNTHTVDFSSFMLEGSQYTLSTDDGSTSFPFAISKDLYDALRQDSIQFFYFQRSGIAIDGLNAGPEYARAAGHVQVAPNQVRVGLISRIEWKITTGSYWLATELIYVRVI